MAGLVEGAIVGAAVSKLLDTVLKGVSLLVKSNENFSALCVMLTSLKPMVADITRQTEPNSPWNPWLQRLNQQLEKAYGLVVKFQKQSTWKFPMKLKLSAELLEITKTIRDLQVEAVIAGFCVQLENSEMIAELVKLMQTNLQDLKLSGTTRNAVSSKVTKPFGLTTTSSIQREIREADAVTTPNDPSRRSDNGASSSNTEKLGGNSEITEKWFGDDKCLEEVKELLLSDQKFKWVGIWSMGGAGKTLTAQRVYKDLDIQNHFVGGTLWLTVGREQTPLSLLSLLDEEIRRLVKKKATQNEVTKEDVEEMKSKLGDHVLLVLDDVWKMKDLNPLNSFIQNVAHHASSKIFVTTRDGSLLDGVFPNLKMLRVPPLSPEHSWQLFCWHAFGGEKNVSQSLEEDARNVADQCKGLPLALKVIGSTMCGKSDPKFWQINLKQLQHAAEISETHEEELFGRLQLSIDDLCPSEIDCLGYFAAFPEDYSVHLDDLLSLWMGEGIVRGTSALSSEDEAYLILGRLIARSLIELNANDDRLDYKIHDVLRDLIRHNLQHDRKPDQRSCLYQPGMQLTRFPEDWKSSHLQTSTTSSSCSFLPSVKRMSLMFNDLVELPSQGLIAPDLLVFLVRGNKRIESLPKRFFAGLSNLRVLDLSSTGIREILPATFRDLKHLVLLNLSWCSNLKKIPDSIKYLQNLKEFRLNDCNKLEAIPSGVRFLKNLQILDTDESDVWNHQKSEFCPLRLRSCWIPTGVASLHDVSCLTALTNLRVSSDSLTELSVDFNSLKLLRHLDVNFPELRSFPDPRNLKELESLTLCSDALTELPEGITVLPNLREITIDCMSLCSLPALDKLPLLKHLRLDSSFELRLPESVGRPGSFPSLEELEMLPYSRFFPNLDPGAMPKLTSLSLRWGNLRQLPESLRVLQNLRCLDLTLWGALETLEPVFDLSSFPRLEELSLQSTGLTRLPGFLAAKPTLVKLDLTDCPAGRDLPPEFQNVERLHIIRTS